MPPTNTDGPLDDTGKLNFDDIYNSPDPRAYFRTLRPLGYQIPGIARPFFAAVIGALGRDATVLDVGCSYGINAALLSRGVSLARLFEHYTDTDRDTDRVPLDRGAMIERDQRELPVPSGAARFVGLDISAHAVDYAVAAGHLDAAVHADFEACEPTAAQCAQLRDVDLVVSTGCLGYVTDKTLRRVVQCARRPPVMVHFVLRMFDYRRMARSLQPWGYETVALAGLYPQRRFASTQERTQILATLRAQGINPTGIEDQGWFFAELFLSSVTRTAELAALLSSMISDQPATMRTSE